MKTKQKEEPPAVRPDFNSFVTGISKREYFAAMALSGMAHGYSAPDQAAQMAVAFADALIKELK